jgi:uncharacterized protein (DUF736 family)
MPSNRDRNEVGAMWKKVNDRGDYYSLNLDMDALLGLTGGTTGKVDLKVYPITFTKTNPNAPDYRVKYYPPGERGRREPAPAPLDDDIPI